MYGQHSVEGASEVPEEQLEGANIGYFDYMSLQTPMNAWQQQQPQHAQPNPQQTSQAQPPQQAHTPSQNSSTQPTRANSVQLLDPMDELERDLLGLENSDFTGIIPPQLNQNQMQMMDMPYGSRMMNFDSQVGMMPNTMQTHHETQMAQSQLHRRQLQQRQLQQAQAQQAQHAQAQHAQQAQAQQAQMQQPQMQPPIQQSQIQQPHMQPQQMQQPHLQRPQMRQAHLQAPQMQQPQMQQSHMQQPTLQQTQQLRPQMQAQQLQMSSQMPSTMQPQIQSQLPSQMTPQLPPQLQQQLQSHIQSQLQSQTQPQPQNVSLRNRYKPRSSIPPDLSSANYAAQCIAAAESSRLPPYSLSVGEYNHLRNNLPHVHVTTYLNIRNGILRLWLANPLVSVTIVEAAGCCKEARYYPLAEFAFEWLVRNGYINQGCYSHVNRTSASTIASLPQFNHRKRKPRQTIVVIGAGIAGLCCARQLENLLERYSEQILTEYEELPRVLVLEARKRIGGRVYSPLLTTEHTSVDLGGDTIMGFGGGNPLGVVMRRQLGIPVVSVDTTSDNNVLYSSRTGDPIGAQSDYRAHEIFKHLLDRMKIFEVSQAHTLLSGVKTLIRAGQDPRITDPEQEKVSIAQFEEQEERPHSHELSDDNSDAEKTQQVLSKELEFLEGLGLPVHKSSPVNNEHETRVHAEQFDNGASLGLTMNKVMERLEHLTDLSKDDLDALNWYFAKFEYQIGDKIDRASLSSWSHHRQNRFTGRYAWARDGMGTLLKGLDVVPGKLDVRFKTVVNVIEYDDDSAELTLENGEQVHVDRCVITVPLGCLKRRSVQFIPDLPKWKSDSIDRLEFGVVNKVVLVFDQPFWGSNEPSLIRIANDVGEDGSDNKKRGECFVFQNHTKRCDEGTKSLIVGLVSGSAAADFAEISDYEIIERAVAKLRHIFRKHPNAQSSKLIESVVTRWQLDRFTRGAFSHVGVEGTSTDHDLLARPVLHSLFFAGEATCRPFPGTMHGAYISGLRAAKEVLNSLVGGIEVPEKLIDDELANSLLVHNTEVKDENAMAGHIAGQLSGAMSGQISVSGTNSGSGSASGSVVAEEIDTTPISNMNLPVVDAGATLGSTKRHMQESPYVPILSYELAERELEELRHHREELEKEQLERDMMHEIGQRPMKPERHGITNPFLLFQKDYWEICRQETEASKLREKRSGVGSSESHASRNEIRAGLGKKWRSLPEEERAPYIERSRQAKVENEERQELYYRKLKWYESEAANFQQQWVQEHPSQPSPRERELEKQLEALRPKKKRSRLTE